MRATTERRAVSKRRTFAAALAAVFLAAGLTSCDNLLDVLEPDVTTPAPTLKIGVIQPSQFFISFLRGAEMARQELNAGDGVIGMQVEFILRDNQGSDIFPTAEKTIAAAHELINAEGVTAILGPILSTNSVALGNALTEAGVKIPMLPGSVSATVPQSYSHYVLTVSNNLVQANITANFAYTELGIGSVGIASLAPDEFSRVLTERFARDYGALGGTITASVEYAIGATDFAPQIQTLMDSEPEAILLASFAPEVPLFIEQARAMGYDGQFIGTDGWDDFATFYNVLDDNSVMDGSYYTANFFPGSGDPTADAFADAFMSAYGIIADSTAAAGYDSMKLLAQAIETAKEGMDGEYLPDADAILAALLATKDYRGATAISHFDESRSPVKEYVILTIENGAPAFHRTWPDSRIDAGGDAE